MECEVCKKDKPWINGNYTSTGWICSTCDCEKQEESIVSEMEWDFTHDKSQSE